MAATEVAVPATATAARTRSRTSAGTAASNIARTSRASASMSSRAGGSPSQVALAVAHHARLGGDVEVHLPARARDELGRAAADVDHEQRRRVAAVAGGGRPEVGQPRLLVAAERAPVEAEAVAHRRGELRAVGRVADRGRQHGDAALAAVALDRLRVALERVEHAPLRRVAEPAGRVHALAEAGDDRAAVELLDAAGADVGDEQARRVRADVDDRDAHAQAG